MRFATSRPILPRPMMANVLPFNSSPMKVDRCHAPDFNDVQALGMLLHERLIKIQRQQRAILYLAKEQINAQVCSAAESVFPPGVLQDGTGRQMRKKERDALHDENSMTSSGVRVDVVRACPGASDQF